MISQLIGPPSPGSNSLNLLQHICLSLLKKKLVEREGGYTAKKGKLSVTEQTSWDSKDRSLWNVPERDTESSNFTVVALCLTPERSKRTVSSSGINKSKESYKNCLETRSCAVHTQLSNAEKGFRCSTTMWTCTLVKPILNICIRRFLIEDHNDTINIMLTVAKYPYGVDEMSLWSCRISCLLIWLPQSPLATTITDMKSRHHVFN